MENRLEEMQKELLIMKEKIQDMKLAKLGYELVIDEEDPFVLTIKKLKN